jgi:Collagen triple helix repeat (20 copies)
MGLVEKIVLFWVGLAVVTPAFAVEATLVADAHVNSARPAVNSGTISNLNAGGGYTALLQFDLSTLPVGTTSAQVTRAMLRLYCNRVDTAGLVSVQALGGAWGEYSVTYATLPALASAVQVVSVSQAGAYVTVDVTSLVQGWVAAPATNFGLALTAGTAGVQFDSKENDLTGHAALLDVTLATAGTPGPAGPAGQTGSMGPAGPMGLTGPAGLQGVAGVAGARGLTGATGPAGPAGLQGVAGPTGATGAVGPAGAPGFAYQGAYAPTTNYALGDVVLWQGASYTSLIAGNHGNTPSASPEQWGVLTAQGPVGAAGAQGLQGAAGPQGLPGSVGPNGPLGPQGLQGIPGQPGAQGLSGATGAQGLSGPMGPQGAAGPVGMSFQGAYSSTTNYALADGVVFGGAGYVSLVAGNHGNTPDQSPGQWALFASGGVGPAGPQGAAGSQGLTGPAGPQGLPGVAGAVGATGPQGPPVANYTGNYSSTTNYALNDAVSFGGSTYISLVGGNHGNAPNVSPGQWAVLAAQGIAGPAGAAGTAGATGAAGQAGATGATGPQGPPVSFLGGWLVGQSYGVGAAVSFLGSSYVALAASVGREPDLSPAFWGLLAQAGVAGPAGTTGAAGPAGAAGAVGMNYRGTWSSLVQYQTADAAVFGGTTYLAQGNSLGMEPDLNPAKWAVLAAQGSAGPTGPGGAAASVSVGTVTTGAAGSQVSVTNSGTASAAVLNFTIPQGAAGANGTGGGGGGALSASMYHSVSFNAAFYSVNNTNSALSEGTAELTWIPTGCTATALTVFSQQSNTIVVTLRHGTPGTMQPTALSCSVASGGTCTVTGSVTVAPGSFVDLGVTGSSGVSAAVWTALTCD